MDTATLSYVTGTGWSRAFPDLDSDRTLVVAFGSPEFLEQPAVLEGLAAAYPRAKLLGCSSAGEICGTHVRDHSLAVTVARFDRTEVRLASTRLRDGQSSSEAGRALAADLARPDLRAILVLSEGLAVNGTDLVAGIHGVIGPEVVVTGGLAGDGGNFKQTWVLDGGRPARDAIVAVGLYGDAVGVGHGSAGGWDVFGPERVVTRATANVLYELDGQPALALYKQYLGERASGLPATALLFPLSVRAAEGAPALVRTILAVDEASGSMTFAGNIPEGSVVQLMRANFDRLIEAASDAGEAAAAGAEGTSVTIAVSCVGRRLVLGERTEEEVEATCESLTEPESLVGFYSYGEISPSLKGGFGALHNQTMTVTRIWERA